jgi:hypothetical protein
MASTKSLNEAGLKLSGDTLFQSYFVAMHPEEAAGGSFCRFHG